MEETLRKKRLNNKIKKQSFTYENSRRAMNHSPEIGQESDRRVMRNEMLRCVRIVEERYK